MIEILIACLTMVTHAPGWSEAVISIQEASTVGAQRKDLIVTDGNHVHQIWNKYEDESRVGYNRVLPDGTVLLEDTMLSRDVYSTYPRCGLFGVDGFIGFWRESTPIWFARRDHEGGEVTPPALFSSDSWQQYPDVLSSPDSLGRVHVTWTGAPEIRYSILHPVLGEVFRDTIHGSMRSSLILVDGDRVHIKFNDTSNWADYIQYDLEGNVTVGPVSLVEGSIDACDHCGLAADSEGNALVFVRESYSGQPVRLVLYKIDGDTGEKLIDGLILYEPPFWEDAFDPVILARPGGESFYLMWREDDPETSQPLLIRFAVIDSWGNFTVEPYTAYDYTDEYPDEDIQILRATTNEVGDVFAIWSEGDPTIPGYWIRLGWFDHNWLGVEEGAEPVPPSDFTLSASQNPFTESVTFTVEADPLPGQLMVYDITGRLIRSLGDGQGGNTFPWDGTDASGNVVPPGTYLIQGASAGRLATVRLVKL